MPEDLWAAAAAVAREHGVWSVSRALGVNYESLKQRVGSASEDTGAAGFVEVSPGVLFGEASAQTTVVELSSGGGARLMVRIEGQAPLDLSALAAAFWQRHR